jgi:hypothetical protein
MDLGFGGTGLVALGHPHYFFVDDGGQYDYMTYLLAALVVLLPIAFVVDLLYSRRDPAQKHGFCGRGDGA